jgi:hypothetical protein
MITQLKKNKGSYSNGRGLFTYLKWQSFDWALLLGLLPAAVPSEIECSPIARHGHGMAACHLQPLKNGLSPQANGLMGLYQRIADLKGHLLLHSSSSNVYPSEVSFR